MLSLLAAAPASWPRCTQRAPPDYGASPSDHVRLATGVDSGDAALPFALPRAANTSSLVTLDNLLKVKPVFLQFGAYT